MNQTNEQRAAERGQTDHERMMRDLNRMSEDYPFLSITYVGESIMGRGIPMISLGEGEKTVLYVGGHRGTEWITSAVLLRWIGEYGELYKGRGRSFGYSIPYLFTSRTVCVVPMLNPDGVDYQINGVAEDHVLYDRLLSMNDGSTDFTHWQANARGVDLTHNCAIGFADYKHTASSSGILGGAPVGFCGEMPESEPEIGQLCNYLRYHQEIKMVLSLYLQGEGIQYLGGDNALPRVGSIAGALSRLGDYAARETEERDADGNFTDWCTSFLQIPSFSLQCDKKERSDSFKDCFDLYARVRKMLFLAPVLI